MLLAVDTSTRWVGLALYDGYQVLGETVWQTHNHHTVELAPAVDQLLKRCAVKPEALEAFGVALGPGSFTSLRIGLALAKGMALALRLPLVGVPSLDVLAYSQPVQSMPLAAALVAGRGRLAVGWYEAVNGQWRSSAPIEVLDAAGLGQKITTPTLVAGELEKSARVYFSQKVKDAILASPAQSMRRPACLAELAWKRIYEGRGDDPVSLAPIYLHTGEAIPE